jgi:cyanophycinase
MHGPCALRSLALAAVLAAFLPAVSAAQSPTRTGREKRLILLGGNPRAKGMWLAFSAYAGGPQARGVILPWASGDPDGSLAAIQQELEGIRPPGFFDMAPSVPLDAAARQKTLELLGKASAIFILGGDQNKFLDVVEDPGIRSAILARYEAGVVVAASDGGAIAAGAIAVTGEDDPTIVDGTQVGNRPGLGLLPRAILDTQFVKRQRYNRMLGMLLLHPDKYVVGIGSGTALVLRDNCEGDVIAGPDPRVAIVVAMKTVQAVTDEAPGHVEMALLRPGNKFDCEFFAEK